MSRIDPHDQFLPGDPANTELYGERVEQGSLVSGETVYRRIFTATLIARIDFRQELLPGEDPPSYEDLLAEVRRLDPHVAAILLVSVGLTGDVHECTPDCRSYGRPDDSEAITVGEQAE